MREPPAGPGMAGDLTPRQAAEARRRLYALLSRLVLAGPDLEVLGLLRSLPGLDAALPADLDTDAFAAEHHTLFSFNLHPYQGLFLTGEALVGGAEAERVQETYHGAGWQPPAKASPDHLGIELAFLSALCEREAADVPAAQEFLPRFLAEHLLRWLPPLVLAVAQRRRPLYQTAFDLLLHLVAAELPEEPAARAEPAFTLPNPPPLDPAQAGMADIARHLTTPAHSGLFLARDDLRSVARRQGLLLGFGTRHQLVRDLFQAAGARSAVPALLDDLSAVVLTWQEGYSEMGADLPALRPWLSPWQSRTAATHELLADLAHQAASTTSSAASHFQHDPSESL